MTFPEIYRGIDAVVGEDRCLQLYAWSRACAALPGDMAEVGVYKGGTSLLLARANPGKLIHAFDTFAGIPNAQKEIDGHNTGDFCDLDAGAVIRSLEAEPNIEVHVGTFPDTAPSDQAFCFAHFDGDTYASCKAFLHYFRPRLSPGGVLMFDDYGWHRCPGVELAIKEFGLKPYQTATHQCILFG